MSNNTFSYLRKYPYLVRYAQNGLVNFNALARLNKSERKLSAIGMGLRRFIARQPKMPIAPFDFSQYKLQLVTRTNIHEIILNKNLENRKECLKIVDEISRIKHFVSVVEGEKEIVVMTDCPLAELLRKKSLKEVVNHITRDLSFISVDFPIKMREVPGIYSLVTSSLADAQIPIHSFHTIGGEILILVKNKDLVYAQEILHLLLFDQV